ncbi:MAG: VC0807 family protein [Actinocatenispora sp.]
MSEPTTIHLPALGVHLRHGLTHLMEATLIPLGLFYLVLTLTGLHGALFAALGWSLTALVWRAVTRRPIPTVLAFMTALLVVRTAIGFATGSVFLYFISPSVQDFVIGVAFLALLPFGRSLIAKLAADFCVFPRSLTDNPKVRRFFHQVSVLWSSVFLVSGGFTLWMLARTSLASYLVIGTATSYALVVAAIVISLLWFRRTLRREGIHLRLPLRTPAVKGLSTTTH